jgi:GMP synthase-like glutamine amidotransferase
MKKNAPMGPALAPLRVCIVDMNAGHANQAMRCFRGLVGDFFERARAANPTLPCDVVEVSPRNTDDRLPRDADIYISSGGPGSPFDGDGTEWLADYARFLDGFAERASRGEGDPQAYFGICFSFELLVHHFKVASLQKKAHRKFGIMPVYPTTDGQRHPLYEPFGDRLFAFEHRNWEVVDVDDARMAALGGQVLARESRDGHSKGRSVVSFAIGSGIEGVLFHPEADRAGVMNWLSRPEEAEAFRSAYGDKTYQAMLRTVDDPARLARTYSLFVPGWLTRKFNALASTRGYRELAAPVHEVEAAEACAADSEPPRVANA